MATPNDPRYLRDGTPRDGVVRNRNPLETPSTAPRAVGAPTQGTVTLPFSGGRTPTGRTDAELATMAAAQSTAADADIARRRIADRNGTSPIAEGTVGYFVGSDGRKQTFTREGADAKAAMLPTSNTMPVSAGGRNFAASNDARRTVGVPAVTTAAQQAATDASDGARYQAAIASGMGPRAAMESLGAPTPPPAGTPSSVTTPTGVSTVAAGTGGMARRPAVDEFNAIREGLARPGQYDPSGATGRARGAATSVVRSNSDANRIMQMAANLASDPRLKGFPGARNAIIQGLVGQIGADSDAALEGLRQTGQAGISAQDFGQDGVLQETGRRGQALRDQFLTENEERLQALNNDAALERTIVGGLLSGQGRGRNGGDGIQKYADNAYERYLDQEGTSPQAAAIRAAGELGASGVPLEATPQGNYGLRAGNEVVVDAFNNDLMPWSGADSRVVPAGGVDLQDWTLAPDDWTKIFDPFDWGDETLLATSPSGVTQRLDLAEVGDGTLTLGDLQGARAAAQAAKRRLGEPRE